MATRKNQKESINNLVDKYLLSYHKKTGISKPILYSDVIANVLRDHKKRPRNSEDVGRFLKQIFRGKKVMEPGCRRGQFLRFLREHGAIVMGSTKTDIKGIIKYFDNFETAKSLLGKKSIFEAYVTETGKIREMRNFKPDYIFSVNLLTNLREWPNYEPPFRELYAHFRALATPNTICYLHPTFEGKPAIKFKHLKKLAEQGRITKPKHLGKVNKKKIRPKQFNRPVFHTFKFSFIKGARKRMRA